MLKSDSTATVSLQDVYQGYANQATASEPKVISLLNKYNVVFTSDFKDIKAGTKLEGISQVAFDFYSQNGVVKEA
jgi:hypothetical protein